MKEISKTTWLTKVLHGYAHISNDGQTMMLEYIDGVGTCLSAVAVADEPFDQLTRKRAKEAWALPKDSPYGVMDNLTEDERLTVIYVQHYSSLMNGECGCYLCAFLLIKDGLIDSKTITELIQRRIDSTVPGSARV